MAVPTYNVTNPISLSYVLLYVGYSLLLDPCNTSSFTCCYHATQVFKIFSILQLLLICKGDGCLG
jgi:hypothetical protein